MTSLDDDGSTQHTATGGGSADHGPVPLSPPADPWLTEAHTSVIGEGPAAPIPLPDPVPYDNPASGWTDEPRRRRRRGPARLLVAILAGAAVFVVAVPALDRFGPDDSDSTAPAPSTAAGPTTATVTTGPAAPATTTTVPPQVVYEVTASGSGNTGSVGYTDQDGDIIRRNGIALPWRTTFPAGATYQPLVLIAQRTGGGDTGPVTCTITVNGKVLAATTADGRYAAPQCSG